MLPLILHIETSTEICSVALSRGDEFVGYVASEQNMDHAARLTLMIGECLSEAGLTPRDLSAISISAGPGSYTALRIGTSVAKGMCYALGVPLIAVDTLGSLAAAAISELSLTDAIVVPMIDARRMEVYTTFYDTSGKAIVPLHSLIVCEATFDEYLAKGVQIVLTGNGAEKCRSVLPESPLLQYYPLACSARHMISAARTKFATKVFADLVGFTPEYCKQPNITTPKNMFS